MTKQLPKKHIPKAKPKRAPTSSRLEVEAPQIPPPRVLAELERQYQEEQKKKGSN